MKKLVLTALLILSAAVLKASTVIWGLYDTVDTTKFASGTAYLICVDNLARPTFADDTAATAWFTENGSSLASLAFRSTTVTDGAVSATEVIDEDIGRKNYWLLIVNDDSTALAVSSSQKALQIKTGTMNVTGKWTGSTQMNSYVLGNVPEPTSGMLLLLGVAGLMLRRKLV